MERNWSYSEILTHDLLVRSLNLKLSYLYGGPMKAKETAYPTILPIKIKHEEMDTFLSQEQ